MIHIIDPAQWATPARPAPEISQILGSDRLTQMARLVAVRRSDGRYDVVKCRNEDVSGPVHFWETGRSRHAGNRGTRDSRFMTSTRRQFLASLAVAAVAPGALSRAAASATSAPPQTVVLWGCTTQAQVTRAALWARQCGRLPNPAWIFYDLCRERYGEVALDRSSFEQLAALCEEPVTTPPS